MPSYMLEKFYNGEFDPLSDEERRLLSVFEDKRSKRFYIIGTSEETTDDLKHEIAHGLFYTNCEYNRQVINVLADMGEAARQRFTEFLVKEGYHESVLKDEIHAYIVADIEYLEKERGLDMSAYLETNRRLRKIFDNFKNN